MRRIAKELHYEPNAAAQALANSKKKMRIAVLLNSGGNPFFDKVRAGLEEGVRSAKTYGIAVDIYEMTGFLVEEQLAHIDALMEKPPHALIITPINDPRIIAAVKPDCGGRRFHIHTECGCDRVEKALLCRLQLYQKRTDSGRAAGTDDGGGSPRRHPDRFF